MRIDPDPLKQYVEIRERLLQEKSRLEARLRELNQTFGETGTATAKTDALQPAALLRVSSPLSFRQAIIQVTSKVALPKKLILEEVKKLGVKINSKNPDSYLNSILYGSNPRFHRANGQFSLASAQGKAAAVPALKRPGTGKKAKAQEASSASRALPGKSKGGAANRLTLRETIVKALGRGPLGRKELVEAVKEHGYVFKTKDPLNSMGPILYGMKPKLDRAGGKFSLPKGFKAA
jgi:hypothetical protein